MKQKTNKKTRITAVEFNGVLLTEFDDIPEPIIAWFNVLSPEKRKYITNELTKMV